MLKRKAERRVFADKTTPRILALAPSAVGADYGVAPREEMTGPGIIACICVDGPLTQNDDGWFESYECLTDRFVNTINDEDVAGVILKFNSPGGDVAGLFETVMTMKRAKKKAGKPVIAYVDESCYSAAYALAMAADKIYMPPAAGCGSIGVITCMVDLTEANEQAGVRVEVITSGDEKTDGHPDVPLTDEAIERTQARVDDLAAMFWGLVAQARGLSPETVAGYQAGIFQGQDAVDAGLADGLMSWADFVPAVAQLALSKQEKQAMAANKMAAIKAENERAKLAASDPSAEVKFKHTKKMIEVIESEDDPSAEDDASSDGDDSEAPSSAPPPKKKGEKSEALVALLQELTGKRTTAGITGALMAMSEAKTREVAMAKRIEKLEAEREQERVDALVQKGLSAGKIAPSQKAWASSMSRTTLKAYLDATPSMVHRVEDETEEKAVVTKNERVITAAMKEVWTKMGIKPEQFGACVAQMDDHIYAKLEKK